MDLSIITPVILTYNEGQNINRCLDKLRWANRVLVVDSGSTDTTLDICAQFPNVIVKSRGFDNHTAQWNFAIEATETPWVLSLDADYILTESFLDELRSVEPPPDLDAYYVPFTYCVLGKRLNGSLYPPRAALFLRDRCRYQPDGHTQLLEIPGKTEMLKERIDHDDRKPLTRWLESQRKYATLEADKLLSPNAPKGGMADRLRRMIWPAVPTVFFYTYICKGLIFDGWPGLYYTLQRVYAELLLSLELLDRKLAPEKSAPPQN